MRDMVRICLWLEWIEGLIPGGNLGCYLRKRVEEKLKGLK